MIFLVHRNISVTTKLIIEQNMEDFRLQVVISRFSINIYADEYRQLVCNRVIDNELVTTAKRNVFDCVAV